MPSVGILTLELRLDDAHTLKEKRQIVRSLKDRLRHKFNIAVAEIDYQELWQRSLIAAVTVSADRQHAASTLQSAEEDAAAILGPILVLAAVEWME